MAEGYERSVGIVVALTGIVAVLRYPALALSQDPFRNLPAYEHQRVIFLSLFVGPILFTWGQATARNETLRSLTPRDALVAPVVAAATLVVGVVGFVYALGSQTPVEIRGDMGAQRVWDPTTMELARMWFSTGLLIPIGAVAFLLVGVVAARRGTRSALVYAVLPVGAVISVTIYPQPDAGIPYALFLSGLLSLLPLVAGYSVAELQVDSTVAA